MKINIAYRLYDKPNGTVKTLNIPDEVVDGEEFDEECEIAIAILAYLLAEDKITQADIAKLELTWKEIT